MNRQTTIALHRRASLLLVITILLYALASPASAEDTGSSGTLTELIDRARGKDPTVGFAEFPQLLAAALGPENEILEEARAREQEGPQVDQQKGATSDASGTTTLTEKPGIAELLNLAIESGAITKTTSGTSFTLQTTPYLLYSKFGASDTAKTWDSLTALRRIALSATFDEGTSDAEPSRNNFQKGQVKYTWGERSPRDKEFRRSLRSIMESNIDAISSSANGLLFEFHRGLSDSAEGEFNAAVARLIGWRKAQKLPIDREKLMEKLREEAGTVRPKLLPDDLARLKELLSALAGEGAAMANVSQLLTNEAKKYLEEPHSLFSLAGSFNRDPKISDFSKVNLIYGYDADTKLTFGLNGEVIFNNKRTAADGTDLDRVRAYSVAGDLTLGKFFKDTADFTLAAKLTLPEGESHDMASVQAKLNLYLVRGVTIPVALTYSNRTESEDRSQVRLNVGVSLSGDAFMGMARGNP